MFNTNIGVLQPKSNALRAVPINTLLNVNVQRSKSETLSFVVSLSGARVNLNAGQADLRGFSYFIPNYALEKLRLISSLSSCVSLRTLRLCAKKACFTQSRQERKGRKQERDS